MQHSISLSETAQATANKTLAALERIGTELERSNDIDLAQLKVTAAIAELGHQGVSGDWLKAIIKELEG